MLITSLKVFKNEKKRNQLLQIQMISCTVIFFQMSITSLKALTKEKKRNYLSQIQIVSCTRKLSNVKNVIENVDKRNEKKPIFANPNDKLCWKTFKF